MGSQTFEVRCDHEALQFSLGSLIGRALNGGQQEARGVGATPGVSKAGNPRLRTTLIQLVAMAAPSAAIGAGPMV